MRVVGRATSIGRVLLALPLLATRGVGARRPVGVELHVQLPLPARQLIVLGLLLAAQRVPLNRTYRVSNVTRRARQAPREAARKNRDLPAGRRPILLWRVCTSPRPAGAVLGAGRRRPASGLVRVRVYLPTRLVCVLSFASSSWCRSRNCPARSSPGTAACAVGAPGAPSRNTWPAPRGSESATKQPHH